MLGPLSNRLDVDGKPRNVHAKFLKENAVKVINRVTTMLEDDKEKDDVTVTNDKLHIEGVVVDEAKQKDIDAWTSEFGDVIRQEPGLTNLVELSIDTGGAPPISQRYNAPMSLREEVSKDIDWLLDKGYVRPTDSYWASPIVNVKKPDGSIRLCIDYKRLNKVTVPAPFYMPTVEEVLESVGTACVISKLDLNKRYYQVKVRQEDISKTAFVCHSGLNAYI